MISFVALCSISWAGGSGTARAAEQWEPVAIPTTQEIRGIWGTAADDIFAVGTGGAIIHYDGTAWTAMPPYPDAG